MPLRVVVLPVPGPPVKIRIPLFTAVLMASFCFSAYSILQDFSIFAICIFTSIGFSGGYFTNTLSLFAIDFSALYASGKNTKSRLPIFSQISLFVLKRLSIAISILSLFSPNKSPDGTNNFSSGKQV